MTDSVDLSSILKELSEGRIDAAEAARRIDALNGDAPAASSSEDWALKEPRRAAPEEPVVDEEPSASHRRASSKGVERVVITAVGRRVRVVGDRSVATATADGPHVLRRNGRTLEISSDGEAGPSIDGFTFLRPPRSLDDLRTIGFGRELLIKVNPDLLVDVEVTAGSLHTDDIAHLGKVRVTAGGARLSGVREVADALIQAGQATIQGRITTGRSRIRVESGSLKITLDDGSNVTVRAESQAGRIAWSGGHSGAGDEVVMGNGSARLDVSVVMGLGAIVVGSTDRTDDE